MWSLSIPIVLTNLSQQAMQTTDVLMIGRLGSSELAASALSVSYFWLLFLFGFGIVNAGSGIMAQDLGRKLHAVREVRRTVRQSIWIALLLFALFLPAWWNGDLFLLAIGQDPTLVALSRTYLRALLWCFPPMMVFFSLRGFVSALERPASAMFVTFAAIGFNILANWVLIFGNLGFPALGMTGAGLATTASSCFSVLLLTAILYSDRQFRRFHVFGRFWRPDWEKFHQLFVIGGPAGATWVLEVGVFTGATFLMGWIGQAQLAAHNIALQLPAITFMVPMGLGMAATVRVGLAAGAGDRDGVRRAGWTAMALGVGFMAAMAAPMWLFPDFLAGLFLDADDEGVAEVLGFTATFLAIAALFQVFDGAQAIGQGVLRGLKDTRVPMLMALFSFWIVGLPISVLLGFGTSLDGVGVWIGLAVGLAVISVLLIWRFQIRDRLGLIPPPRDA